MFFVSMVFRSMEMSGLPSPHDMVYALSVVGS